MVLVENGIDPDGMPWEDAQGLATSLEARRKCIPRHLWIVEYAEAAESARWEAAAQL